MEIVQKRKFLQPTNISGIRQKKKDFKYIVTLFL